MLYTNKNLDIFFGDARCAIDRTVFGQNSAQVEFNFMSVLEDIKKQLQLESYIFTKQTHSAHGFVVSQENYTSFLHELPEGDFLVTDKAKIGLGVYTADCLPLIIYDPENHAVALCHAGWMGSVKGIAIKALDLLEKTYGTKRNQVEVFFGPSAGVCCYQVQHDFKDILKEYSFADQVLLERSGKLFFDLVLFNKLQLLACGVNANAFNYAYTSCTIHNLSFCSYRRDAQSPLRQVSLVALKERILVR